MKNERKHLALSLVYTSFMMGLLYLIFTNLDKVLSGKPLAYVMLLIVTVAMVSYLKGYHDKEELRKVLKDDRDEQSSI